MVAKLQKNGFTIIELMIATLIFGVILVVITTAILQFTRQYYRGVTSNTTQNAARTIVDELSRSLQFDKGGFSSLAPLPDGSTGFCLGGTRRYSYVLNRQLTDSGPQYHVLVADDVSSCNTTGPVDIAALPAGPISGLTNARELLGQHMRLVKFSVQSLSPTLPSAYAVSVRIIYGDDDLLCSPSANDCAATTPSSNLTNTDITCKLQIGSQFCAPSELTTIITKRVN